MLAGVQEYGEESAMGVYNLMDHAGGSAGPMLFGAIMAAFSRCMVWQSLRQCQER